ncbi:MAG: hypothetical protein U9R19_03490 [Bacteroidota bacterium]|nr:hypothetical protein [Bacteroidota bacterium]
MKNKTYLLFGLVAFVFMFASQSCSLVKVDSPNLDVTSDNALEYYVKGVITNADDSQGIEGAIINIGDVSITTDADGNYSYNSETAFANGTVVEVIAEGYVKSTSTLVYGADAPVEYFVDFSLTRVLPSNTINLVLGGDVTFEGGIIKVPENNSVVVDGNTLENIEISVTPLSPFSTLGNWVGSSLKKLKFEPAGANFEKPVTVIINVPEDFVYTEVNLYQFNDANNTWEELNENYSVVYNEINNQISFELKILPIGLHAADPNTINITNDDPALIEAAVRYEPNTCDCEAVFNWYGGYYMRKVELVAGTGSLIELNSLHFFTDYGMPYTAALVNGIIVAPAVPAPGIAIPACKQVDVDVSRKYREVIGTYEYMNENKTFTIRYYYSVQVNSNIVDCPVYSNCHQGC